MCPIQEGVYGESVVRGGLPLYPHAQYQLHYVDTALSAGAHDDTIMTVPAGTVRIITNTAMYYAGTAPTDFQLATRKGSEYVLIFGKKSPVTQEVYPHSCWVMMVEDDTLQLIIVNATLNNDAHVWIHGFDIVLAS